MDPDKRLFIRLSSLGDVVLSTAALDPRRPVDFLVSKEFAPILRGHPGVGEVIEVDRGLGLKGWLKLIGQLRGRGYVEIVDLHQSLRTFIAKRVWFEGNFRSLRKPRLRRLGYFIFKGWWPLRLRPPAWVETFSELGRGDKEGRPDLTHLVKPIEGLPSKFVAVMPSSKWAQKTWPHWVDFLMEEKREILVLGQPSDEASVVLLKKLQALRLNVHDGIGKFSLLEQPGVLSQAQEYIGSDTGLAHIAEAVGTPATMVFGPTTPELGFGPWRGESRSLGADLWCRPCGKDGRTCHRLVNRRKCLKGFSASEARSQLMAEPKPTTWAYEVYRKTLAPLIRWGLTLKLGVRRVEDLPQNALWFHAASAGELESLWSVIEECHRKELGPIVVSAFSLSSKPSLERLRAVADVAFLSPLEGQWRAALEQCKPRAWITAKYEAWPEVWCELRRLGIPTVIVGAKDRSSLRLGRWVSNLLMGGLPSLKLSVVQDSEVLPLKRLFPQAQVIVGGDPRWDRVVERSKRGSERTAEIVAAAKNVPRPWGVMGSAWLSDLEFWGGQLRTLRGTVWLVPHTLDPDHLKEIEGFLLDHDIPVSRTSRGEAKGPWIMVDEMGFLSELYAHADWAYVGGGFEAGIHSTIEPAIHGIPLATGPYRIQAFSETSVLRRTGQLRILTKESELRAFCEGLPELMKHQEEWRGFTQAQLGATQRVMNSFLR